MWIFMKFGIVEIFYNYLTHFNNNKEEESSAIKLADVS